MPAASGRWNRARFHKKAQSHLKTIVNEGREIINNALLQNDTKASELAGGAGISDSNAQPALTTAAQTQIWSGVDGRGVVSAIFAALEQRLDLIVIAEERNEQFRRPVLKNETQRDITPTLEKLIA